ncbi:MAG: NADH-quinone oxidoreductase subunit I [candidate division Zixibacteria bacterium]|nr:NADH-quinone oxidoreductase subunit I [Candidatus Tariuqbacter arcticus]
MEKKIIVKEVELGLLGKIYIVEAIRGVSITGWHFIKNFFTVVAYTFKLRKHRGIITVYYPEERRVVPSIAPRHRHRLMQREDGSPKCVACMMCESACPCYCIHIEAAESPDPKIQKYPARFEIDLLRCCFCGLCVEACPEDAIRMDSGVLEFSVYDRFSDENYYDKEYLLNSVPHISGHPRHHGWETDKYPGETVEIKEM